MDIDVLDLDCNAKGRVIFDEVSDSCPKSLFHDFYLVQRYQDLMIRQGTVSVKTVSEVSGGGAKPYSQKGTGRARRGSSRSALMPGGGIVFGPQPRVFSMKVNNSTFKSVNQKILKLLGSRVVCLDCSDENLIKTKNVSKFISARFSQDVDSLAVSFVLSEKDLFLDRACRNLKNVVCLKPSYVPLKYFVTRGVVFSLVALERFLFCLGVNFRRESV